MMIIDDQRWLAIINNDEYLSTKIDNDQQWSIMINDDQ